MFLLCSHSAVRLDTWLRHSPALKRPPVVRRQAEWEPVSRPDGAPDSNGARSDAKPVPTFADRARELPSKPAGEFVDDATELLGVAVEYERRRGRGAQSNAAGRYEPHARIAFDDGWRSLDELPPFKTTVTTDATRKIITRNDSPRHRLRPLDQSLSRLRARLRLLLRAPDPRLSRSVAGARFRIQVVRQAGSGRPAGEGTGIAELFAEGDRHRHQHPTPISRSSGATKSCARILEVLDRAGHPVGIVTKSALVLRDLDILARMAERRLAKVALSVTTLDPELARKMEPRAATPMRRLETLRRLTQAGVPATVMVAPVIPALNGHGDRAHPRRGAGRRRQGGGLRAAAPAAGSARPVPRMADGELSRPLSPRLQADPRHARRQGLRLDLGQSA